MSSQRWTNTFDVERLQSGQDDDTGDWCQDDDTGDTWWQTTSLMSSMMDTQVCWCFSVNCNKKWTFSDLQVSVDSDAFYGRMHCNWNNCEHFSSNIYLLIILKHQPSSKLFGTVFPVKYDFSFIQRHYFPWRYFTRVVSASCPLIGCSQPILFSDWLKLPKLYSWDLFYR